MRGRKGVFEYNHYLWLAVKREKRDKERKFLGQNESLEPIGRKRKTLRGKIKRR